MLNITFEIALIITNLFSFFIGMLAGMYFFVRKVLPVALNNAFKKAKDEGFFKK